MSNNLFQRVGYVGHQGQVARLGYCLGYFTLELKAGAGNTTGQDAALLVDELQQEVRVFVVDVLDTGFLKAAVLLTGVLLVQTLVGETHFTLLSQLLRTF